MKRYLLAALLASGTAHAQFLNMTACYLSGSSTACIKPVNVASGGTGLISGTSGGILGFTGSGTLASSNALTANQLIVGGGSGVTPSTLAAGTQFQALVMGASAPGYGQINLGQSAAITGTLPVGNGGTGGGSKSAGFDALSPMTTAGDLIYGGTSGTGTRLAGSSGVLHSTGAATPSWATIVNADVDAAAAIVGSKLVAASSGVAGAVSATTQTMTGIKTFETQLIGAGTGTNDDASTGIIGEYMVKSRLLSVATSLSSGVDVNVPSSNITLTPGDWDVRAMVGFAPASGSTIATAFTAAISTNSNPATNPPNDTIAVPTSGQVVMQEPGLGTASGAIVVLSIPPFRVTVATATTLPIYLAARSSFSAAGMSVFGYYSARRVR